MNEANEFELSKLNDELYQRVTDELAAYRESLREMKPDDILGNAYKYTICCDIQCELEYAGELLNELPVIRQRTDDTG